MPAPNARRPQTQAGSAAASDEILETLPPSQELLHFYRERIKSFAEERVRYSMGRECMSMFPLSVQSLASALRSDAFQYQMKTAEFREPTIRFIPFPCRRSCLPV